MFERRVVSVIRVTMCVGMRVEEHTFFFLAAIVIKFFVSSHSCFFFYVNPSAAILLVTKFIPAAAVDKCSRVHSLKSMSLEVHHINGYTM